MALIDEPPRRSRPDDGREVFGIGAALILGLLLLVSTFVIVNAWDHHEARQDRIECAKFNADSENMRFRDEGPAVTIRTKACHPSVP